MERVSGYRRAMTAAGVLVVGTFAVVARADEPVAASEPRLLSETAEITSVVDAFDDGDPFGLGSDTDFLIGCPKGPKSKLTIPGNPPFFISPQPQFVTTRGGEYLYQPSISALRWLTT